MPEVKETDTVPRVFIEQKGGSHVNLELTREQFEEFQRRGVELKPIRGGLLWRR